MKQEYDEDNRAGFTIDREFLENRGGTRSNPMQKLSQHFLIKTDPYRAFLQGLPIKGRRVFEVGVGTGVLTKLILEQNPEVLIGVEIDSRLTFPHDDRLRVMQGDLREINLDFLKDGFCLIANPPYYLLPNIREIIDYYGIKDVVLMTSGWRRDMFGDLTLELEFSGDDFDPPGDGRHLLLRKGFTNVSY